MSLKLECHSKWNVTQHGMSLKIECHLKLNVTQNRISLKMESYIRKGKCRPATTHTTTPPPSRSGYPPWFLKLAGLESSGQKTNRLNWQN